MRMFSDFWFLIDSQKKKEYLEIVLKLKYIKLVLVNFL
jgi:hypothetical protein